MQPVISGPRKIQGDSIPKNRLGKSTKKAQKRHKKGTKKTAPESGAV